MRHLPAMASMAQVDDSELDDDRSEASGFSDDDEMGQRTLSGSDSGAVASDEGGDSGSEADHSDSKVDAGSSDADAEADEQGATVAAAREGGRMRRESLHASLPCKPGAPHPAHLCHSPTVCRRAADTSGAAPAEPLGPFKTAGKGAAIAKAFAKAARGARDESGATMLSVRALVMLVLWFVFL